MRLRGDLAYDGTDFHGWARQPGLRTVQGELEEALATALRRPVATTCAGRTDTGVHARGQVVHFDVDAALLQQVTGRSELPAPQALARRLNGLLTPQIRVRHLQEAPETFDARFGALWRRYVYRISDQEPTRDPLQRTHVLWRPRLLDVEAMDAAAQALVGEHDFSAFCKAREGASTVRTVLDLHVVRDDCGVVLTELRADAFCHNMVRALMGCLVVVGEGRRPVAWAGDVLSAGRRDPQVAVLGPEGLTLEEVRFPPDADLAAQAERTRRFRGSHA